MPPVTPVRRNIANSSASDRDSGPRWSSFSRGRSAAGQSTIDIWAPSAICVMRQTPSKLYHMGTLTNKRVLTGITGGIAAYKSAELVRRLRDAGADVRVVMTQAATEFITPLTMQAVSGNPVHSHLLDADAESGMSHIELARWADTVLVAPASANFIAKMAHGRADDLLSTLCLATEGPVALAPAMNQQMWLNLATQENVAAIKKHGIRIFGPAAGAQACGETGPGRMLEPDCHHASR